MNSTLSGDHPRDSQGSWMTKKLGCYCYDLSKYWLLQLWRWVEMQYNVQRMLSKLTAELIPSFDGRETSGGSFLWIHHKNVSFETRVCLHSKSWWRCWSGLLFPSRDDTRSWSRENKEEKWRGWWFLLLIQVWFLLKNFRSLIMKMWRMMSFSLVLDR